MSAPLEHLEYLRAEFSTRVSIDKYSHEEATVLRRYGSWLRALMVKKIASTTDAQNHFIKMCYGQERPNSFIEETWKRHQLDEMYLVAKKMEREIAKNVFSYPEVVKRFNFLGEQGHVEALKWLADEEISCKPIKPEPLINIARIYPRGKYYEDLLGTPYVLPGSYGSRQ